jgi:hypothetical protein
VFKRKKWFQFLCGIVTKHKPGTDSGYWVNEDGRPMKDYWCKYCDKMFSVQLSDTKVDEQRFLTKRLSALVNK